MANDQLELLAGLAPGEAAAVLALGSRVTLGVGEVLFNLGDVADTLFVVERGRIDLSLPMQVRDQESDLLVEERLPGQALGWSALIPPHRFTLKAVAPLETQLLAFPREALVEHFTARPLVGYTVTRNVAAVVGQRLQVFQAMWLREMQRVVQLRG